METEKRMSPDKYGLRRFDTHKEDDIDFDVLESIPFDYPDSATEVTYETEEFTSVCPWTGLPDFAHLAIRYVPNRHLIELKSLKYYLTSYRNVGILQEHAVNRILRDLVRLLEPASMVIEAYYNERGGLRTKAVAKYEEWWHRVAVKGKCQVFMTSDSVSMAGAGFSCRGRLVE